MPPFTCLAGWADVFQEILNHLEPIDDYADLAGEAYFAAMRSFQNSLLSLALSSQALSDPSLNKLWRSLSSISPLLQLLPSYQSSGTTSYITAEISLEAWSRWLTYATRVRNLCLVQNTGIDPSVWRAIFERSHGTPILPNLRSLSMVRWKPTDALPAFHALVAPSLRSVTFAFRGLAVPNTLNPAATADAALMLQELSVKSSELNQLFLHDYIPLDHDHLMCLSRFTQMEVLHIHHHTTFDETLLLMLVNLKNLARFKVSILLEETSEIPRLDLQGAFQKLTALELSGPAPHLERVMLASSMPELKHVRLRVTSRHDGFHIALASICQHIGPHTLISFRAEVHVPDRRPLPSLMTILQPLLPFANLEDLELTLTECSSLRDEHLGRFGRAWPKLRTLVLPQYEARGGTHETPATRPTLRGLVELARGCLRLDRLCIPGLDVSDTLPQSSTVPLLGHDLRFLGIQHLIGAQDEERQLDVAVVLDRLFPRLNLKSGIQTLPHYDPDNPPAQHSERIARLLRAMQIARTHYPGGAGRILVERAV